MACYEFREGKSDLQFIFLLLWLERHVGSHRMTGRIGSGMNWGRENWRGRRSVLSCGGGSIKEGETDQVVCYRAGGEM